MFWNYLNFQTVERVALRGFNAIGAIMKNRIQKEGKHLMKKSHEFFGSEMFNHKHVIVMSKIYQRSPTRLLN